MKILIVLFLTSSVLLFGEPRKEPITKYRQLWSRSLITIPPTPPEKEAVDETTPLDDYVLGGYTKLQSGYFVSLINTKDRTDRLTISPSVPGSGKYSVLKVETNPENFSDVRVLIRVGTQEKWIGYDEKFLTLSRPAPSQEAAPTTPQASTPARSGGNNNENSQERPRPRVRRVPVPPSN